MVPKIFSKIADSKKLSFKTAEELHLKTAKLPKPPAWKSRIITVDGGTTTKPIELLYRDGLEVFRYEYGNPTFAGHQQNVPQKIWTDKTKTIRILGGPMTGDLPWRVQVCRIQLSSCDTESLIIIRVIRR